MRTAAIPHEPARTPLDPVRIRGRWLGVARAVWWLLAGYSVALFLFGIGPFYQQVQTTCVPAACSEADWFTLGPQQAAGLAELGFSLEHYAAYLALSETLLAAVLVGCGLLIFLRRPDELVAYVASLALVVLGAILIPGAPSAALGNYPGLKPWITSAYLWGNWLFPLMVFLLPDGRLVPRWSWLLVILWGVYTNVAVLSSPSVQEDFSRLGALLLTAVAAVGTYGQVSRYRQAGNPLVRNQIKWIAAGVAGIVFAGVIAALVNPFPASLGERPMAARLVGHAATSLSFSLFPVALAFAILRYRLWEIDVVLNRALVYGLLTLTVVALYTLLVGGFGAVLHSQSSAILAIAGAGLVATLFNPLRERLQRAANHLVYGQRDEPYTVLTKLGRQLESTPALHTLVPAIVTTIQNALKFPQVAIEVDGARAPLDARASKGLPVAFPLVYQHETVGRLIVTPREGESGLSANDRRLLEELARQAAVAVHAARLTIQLQQAREVLVTAREEERRRLRRDLHDGLGPTLAAIATQSEAARDLLPTHPAHSQALLDDILTQAQTATADIRRLVYNLRPPALDDLGLEGAVQAQARKISQPGGLQIHIQAGQLPPLAAAVEVAAYRIVQEALANVAHHAGASACTVALAVDGEFLTIDIHDDGHGFHPAVPPGVGLHSMRERAEELGGALQVASNGQGTRVQARLPLLGRSQRE